MLEQLIQKATNDCAKIIALFLMHNGGIHDGCDTWMEGFIEDPAHYKIKWHTPTSNDNIVSYNNFLTINLMNNLWSVIEEEKRFKYTFIKIINISKNNDFNQTRVEIITDRQQYIDLVEAAGYIENNKR
jgi:hypothetical protein